MPWGAAIAAVGAIGGALISSNSAKSASRAQQQAADAAAAEQQREYDLTRSDYAPYRAAGTNALSQIQQLNNGNYSSFTASPDYNFTRTEGQRGLEQSAAARGGAFSGNALRALSDYNQGLASQQYNNYYNKLAGVAGIGQTATNSTTQAGMNAANNISNAYTNSGDARASGIVGAGNAWSNALGTIGNYGMYSYQNKNSSVGDRKYYGF